MCVSVADEGSARTRFANGSELAKVAFWVCVWVCGCVGGWVDVRLYACGRERAIVFITRMFATIHACMAAFRA